MIRLYDKREQVFGHNETVLHPTVCEVTEEANGSFELTYESALDERIEIGMIIEAPTPRGPQLFRLYKPKHSLRKTKVKGRHIFYDLLGNFLEDSRPTATNGSGAIASILGGTLYPHSFNGISTVANIGTAYYVRKNPVQALIGLDNSLVSRWGGYILRDNYNIKHVADGRDLGYQIRYGKNLKGIDVEIDDSTVSTKLMPTWVNEDNVVQFLPEKYIDSPYINSYPYPRVSELRVTVPEGTTDVESYVRAEASKEFNQKNVDKPLINYKVDFVTLRDLPEYKDFIWSQSIDLLDVVYVNVAKMGIDIRSNVIKYSYDAIKERFNSIEIGNFKNSLAKNTSNLLKEIDNKIEVKSSDLLQKQKDATEKLAGAKGGHIVISRTPEGTPYEILIMDTNDVKTAKNVVRLNQQGMGFSDTGILGPYGVAITIDGHVVADYIDVGTLAAEIIKSGVFADKTGKFYLNMETGAFNFGDKITYNPTTGQFKIDGALLVNMISGQTGKLPGKNITLDGNTTVDGSFKVNGASIFDTVDAQVVRIKNQDLSEFVRGFLSTPTFSTGFGTSQTSLKGSSVAVSTNSSYITLRDTGGRGEFFVQGTAGAKGSGYLIEMNSGGLYLSGSSNAITASTGTVLVNGGIKVLGSGDLTGIQSFQFKDKYVWVDTNGFLKV